MYLRMESKFLIDMLEANKTLSSIKCITKSTTDDIEHIINYLPELFGL